MRTVGSSLRVLHSRQCLRRCSQGRRRDPRGRRNQALAFCFSTKSCVSRLTSHIALFYVLSDSRYYLSHHQRDLGCKSRDSQRRRPLVDQSALYLTFVVLLPDYQEESSRTLTALLFAEKYTRIEFTFEVRILETKLSMSWWRVTISSRTRGAHPPGSADTGFLTALEETRCGPHRCELSSVFMSVTWVSSALRCHHLRVSAFTRVTTNGKVLFERACSSQKTRPHGVDHGGPRVSEHQGPS